MEVTVLAGTRSKLLGRQFDKQTFRIDSDYLRAEIEHVQNETTRTDATKLRL